MMYMRCDEPRQWGDVEDGALSPGAATPTAARRGEEGRSAAHRGIALGAAGVLLVAALTVAGAALVVAGSVEGKAARAPPQPRDLEGLVSLAETHEEGKKKGQGDKKDAAEKKEGSGEAKSHIETIYLANVTRALVLHDVKSQGTSKSLSAKEGDLVIVSKGNSSGPWTFAYTAEASGYLPTEALNKNLTHAVGNYTPPGEDDKGRLEVSVGEKVWLRGDGDRGERWASVDKVASNGTVVKGWVPRWAVDSRGYSAEKKKEEKEEEKED